MCEVFVAFVEVDRASNVKYKKFYTINLKGKPVSLNVEILATTS